MAKRELPTYDEALGLLAASARKGDVRAQIALAGHLRKEQHGDQKPADKSNIVRLASRTARTG